MNLRVHSVSQKRLTNKARLTVNDRTGVIHFNPAAVELLDLKEGQTVAFAEDEDNEGDWYLLPGGKELTVVVLTNHTAAYRIYSRQTCRDILESIGMDGAVRIPLGVTKHQGGAVPMLTRDVAPVRKRGRRMKTAEVV